MMENGNDPLCHWLWRLFIFLLPLLLLLMLVVVVVAACLLGKEYDLSAVVVAVKRRRVL
jgi:hypothetical protein